ncbi:MAG TPA: tetratricopeptide repeat protein [Acidobacteriota bacterium]|nr:tetratricopeptide repeat protein [Acidobacteriota bacterium]
MAADKRKSKSSEAEVHELYGKALTALHSKQFKDAQKLFEKIEKDFPNEIEVIERARCFIRLCERAQNSIANPNTDSAEEAFDLGVFHHNNHGHKEAQSLFQRALELADDDRTDHIHYALAASFVQEGDHKKAIEQLKKAIKLNADNRFFAANDPDFRPLAEDSSFRELVEVDDQDRG